MYFYIVVCYFVQKQFAVVILHEFLMQLNFRSSKSNRLQVSNLGRKYSKEPDLMNVT